MIEPETARFFEGALLGAVAGGLSWLTLYYAVKALLWALPRMVPTL